MRSLLLSILLASLVGQAPAEETLQPFWRFITGGRITGAPALDHRGLVYALSDDRFLYAIDSSGGERWRFALGSRPSGSPVIAYDGTVLAGTVSGRLWAVAPNGRARWSFQAPGGALATPALGQDGSVYLTAGGLLFSLSYRGVERWRYRLRAEAEAGPVLGSDGTLYLATGERRLLALDAGGGRQWELALPGTVSAPAIAADGTLYVGASGLHRLSPAGALQWSYPIPAATAGPVLRGDGSIVAAAANGTVYALSAEGVKLWEAELGEAVLQAPIAARDGTLYVCTDSPSLFVLSGSGERMSSLQAKQAVQQAALCPDGSLYVGSDDWILYRFDASGLEPAGTAGEGIGPARSPWPMAHHDNQHTGRAGALEDLEGPAVQALREMAYADDEELKQRALDDIAQHLRGKRFLPVHLSFLEETLGYLTAEGVTILTYTSGAAAPGFPAVRERACGLLGALASDGARAALLESLRRDPSLKVRLAALDALSEIGLDPGGELGLLLVQDSRRGVEERELLAGIDTLGSILGRGAGDIEDYRALAQLAAASGSRRVRERARKTLTELQRRLP
jgi:outer membrane protein assembly factor BamB